MTALKTQLPQAVALRHEDLYTAGIPDLSVTLAGRTSWWEIKYADPFFKTSKIQKHICTRLAECGVCWYVIFQRGIARQKNPRPETDPRRETVRNRAVAALRNSDQRRRI